jgi:serine/threonine-protein kinase HipA
VSERLAVWLGRHRVGALERSGATIRYVPEIDAPLSVAASGSEPWSPELTRNWFDGLLPEESRRSRLASRFDLRPEDTFGLLREVGWECAGAVAVLPDDRIPATGTYRGVTDDELGDLLDALPSIAEIPDAEIRMSLGGAQDKLLVAWRDGGWALPLDGAPSTHILKPEPERFPGLAVAEAWAMDVARRATPTAEATVARSLGSRPVLVVTRFDRVVLPSGDVRRLHQEDLCQVIGAPPSAKYASNPLRPGSPSLARLAEVLADRAANPASELLRLLTQVVISVALRNTDLHAKNLSIVNDRGVARLTPVYDVSPTTAFIERQRTMGLPVGGKWRVDEIGTIHLVPEAETWGVPVRDAQAQIAETLEALQVGVEAADARWPDVSPKARLEAMAGIFAVSRATPGRRGLQRPPTAS